MLCGAFMMSIITNSTRRLKPIPPFIILFFFGLSGVILSLFALLVDFLSITQEFKISTYPSKAMVYTIVAGFFDSGSALFATVAYQQGATGFVSMISYIAIFYAFLSDLFIFKEKFVFV